MQMQYKEVAASYRWQEDWVEADVILTVIDLKKSQFCVWHRKGKIHTFRTQIVNIWGFVWEEA